MTTNYLIHEKRIMFMDEHQQRMFVTIPGAMKFSFPGRKPALCSWRYVGYQTPKKGDYFVSGAIPEVYDAPNDLPDIVRHHVVEPDRFVRKVTAFVEEETVDEYLTHKAYYERIKEAQNDDG